MFVFQACFLFHVWILKTLIFLCISLTEVFGEERRLPGAGGGPRGGSSSGKPSHRLCGPAAEDPSCSLAAHHHHHHHGLLSALWPQCCKSQLLFHFSKSVESCSLLFHTAKHKLNRHFNETWSHSQSLCKCCWRIICYTWGKTKCPFYCRVTREHEVT